MFCMYIFSTVNIKRDNLCFLSMPWIGSVLADQDTDCLSWLKGFNEEGASSTKEKELDWDNPVCHKNY